MDATITTPLDSDRAAAAAQILAPTVSGFIPRTIEQITMIAQALYDADMVPDSYKVKKKGAASVGAKKNEGDGDDNKEATLARLKIGIMKALEIGAPPIQGINNIYIVNGRPSVWGDLAVALIQRSGVLASMDVEEMGQKPDAKVDDVAGLARGRAEPEGDPRDEEISGPDLRASFQDDYGFKVTMVRKGQEVKPYVGEFTVGDAKRGKLWRNPKKKPWFTHPKDQLFWRAFSRAARRGFSDCLMGLSIREEMEDVDPPRLTVDPSFLALEGPADKQEPGGEGDAADDTTEETTQPETPVERGTRLLADIQDRIALTELYKTIMDELADIPGITDKDPRVIEWKKVCGEKSVALQQTTTT